MLPTTFTLVWAVPALGLTIKPKEYSSPSGPLASRATCGETATRVCFGVGGGTAQNISRDDIEYAAGYLRYLANNNADPLWTMPPEFGCSEWTIPTEGAGSVGISRGPAPNKEQCQILRQPA